MHNNLILSSKRTRVNNAAAAAATNITTGTWLDMEGFDSVQWLAMFGTITSGAATSIQAYASNDSGGSGSVALVGTQVTVLDTDDNNCVTLEVTRVPGYRYLQLQINRATQNAVVDGVVAIQYASHKQPTSDDVTTCRLSRLAISPQPTSTSLTSTDQTVTGCTTVINTTARTAS